MLKKNVYKHEFCSNIFKYHKNIIEFLYKFTNYARLPLF